MVYNKIILIEGYVISVSELVEFLEFLRNSHPYLVPIDYKRETINLITQDKIDWIKENGINFDPSYGFKSFSPRCCSESNDYIIGKKIKTYKRVIIKCTDCDRHFCCDKCIGLSENGYYDVDTILNQVVPVNKNHICKYCHNDNKENAKFACKFCKFQELDGICRPINKWTENHTEKIWFKNKNKSLGYFYQLNDCLSCT
ncbi:hypothetical protein [Moumouvirus maliensis]|nr:hypothetical protein [Moumouvirus maliensis]